MTVIVPSEEEKKEIQHEFSIAKKPKPLRERVELIMKNLKIPISKSNDILMMVNLLGGNSKSDTTLTEFIINTYKAMNE